MTHLHRVARRAAAGLSLVAVGACAGGGLGNVLGGVLGGGGGGGQSGQVSGMVQGIDPRSRQIGIQMSNGQTLVLSYDEQTQVIYQNRNYAVTNLERGDQVTLRVHSNGNGYYTDLVQVDQSVSDSRGGTMGGMGGAVGNVQALQGRVGQIDRANGLFTLEAGNGARVLVSLPSGVSRNDVYTFQRLRPGDYVRFYGAFVTNSRVELRQFF